MTLDPESGRTVATFLFDRSVAAPQLDVVSSMLPAALSDRVRLSTAPVDAADLNSLASDVRRALREDGDRSAGFAIDYWNGKVGIETSDELLADEIRQRFGEKWLRFEHGSDAPASLKSEQQVFGIVWSSLELDLWTTTCTSGFSTSSYWGNMLLTAGHCFDPGYYVYQGGVKVGAVTARNYGTGWFDAETIAAGAYGRPLAGRFHNVADDPAHQINGWIGVNSDSIGMLACHSGVATGGVTGYQNLIERCGEIYNLNFSPGYTGTDFDPKFRTFRGKVRKGDSGGGVWWGTSYGSFTLALVSGHRCDTETCAADGIVSHLPYIQAAWGVTPLTN